MASENTYSTALSRLQSSLKKSIADDKVKHDAAKRLKLEERRKKYHEKSRCILHYLIKFYEFVSFI